MINRIVRAGFQKLEVTSFSHPKLLPQFADAVDVLRRIERRPGVSYVVLMPNMKGFDRLEVCQKEGYGANEIILMISSSEAHNLLNFRMTHDEAMREHAAIMARAHALGIRIIGCAGTVYGCPVGGRPHDRRGREDRPLLPRRGRADDHARRHDRRRQPEARARAHRRADGAVPGRRVHRALPRHARHRHRQLDRDARARRPLRGLLDRRHRRPARDRRGQVLRRLHRQHVQRGPRRRARGDGRRDRHRHRRSSSTRAARRGDPRPAPAVERRSAAARSSTASRRRRRNPAPPFAGQAE